jgi:hypothetical protein
MAGSGRAVGRNRTAPVVGLGALGAACAIFAMCAPRLAMAQEVRSASVLARAGDPVPGLPGWTVVSVNNPVTDIDGSVGFTGTMTNGSLTNVFVWRDAGPVFTGLAAPDYLFQSIEDSMGIGENGAYFFSAVYRQEALPSSADSIWTNLALMPELSEGAAAPGLSNRLLQSLSGPTMVGGGIGYFIASVRPPGGVANERVLYRWTPAVGAIPLYRTGQAVFPAPNNFPISLGSGMSLRYDASDANGHIIHPLQLDTGALFNDQYLSVDGQPALREGDETGDPEFTDRWEAFASGGINNDGQWVASARTSAFADSVVVVNGRVAARELVTTCDGVLIDFPSSVLAVSINNLGQVAHGWRIGSASPGDEVLFVGDARRLDATSRLVVRTGDQLDTTGDGVADWDVTDLDFDTATSSGLDFAEDGMIAVRLKIRAVGTTAEVRAIVRLTVPPLGSLCNYDYNRDENVDLTDAQLMAQVAAGITTRDPLWLDGDLNGDENADLTDAQILAAFVATGVCGV